MPPTFTDLALDALAALVPADATAPELASLRARWGGPVTPARLLLTTGAAGAAPDSFDGRLLRLARALSLDPVDALLLALLCRIELDVGLGRAVARLQEPMGGSRPTLALLATALLALRPEGVPGIAASRAIAMDAVQLLDTEAPLPEQAARAPLALVLTLAGALHPPPGVRLAEPDLPLPASVLDRAPREATALAARPDRGLVLRAVEPDEATATAAAMARALGRHLAVIEAERWPAGLGPWLHLTGALPAIVASPAPGARTRLPALAGYRGPILILAGSEGQVEVDGRSLRTWSLPLPDRTEREALWRAALGDPALAREVARDHLHATARIAALGRIAGHLAALDGREAPSRTDLAAATRSAEGNGLDALAQRVEDAIGDEALVLAPGVREELEALVLRCRGRDTLGADLGPAARSRQRLGVRALLAGPPGTGKTMAAAWLATRLALPLFRVDLAAVVSKYIGETEKNLAELLSRAEADEVVLLFDEADALFGRRTEIRSSNDRFANNQTDYLLQRLESWRGIAVLTTNHRDRLDEAFTRRLDAVIELAAPGPAERRGLWTAHLGEAHEVSPADLNRLAAIAELSGGHIRNVVLLAAVFAGRDERPITYADLQRGLEAEYRKLGKRPPSSLLR